MRLVSSLLLLAAPLARGQTCPVSDPTVACDKSYAPVTCTQGTGRCTYDNACLAGAAGFSGCAPACEEPDPSVSCTTEYAPVACGGFLWCIYSNLCLAKAAGKTEADCTRSCPSLPENTVCTQEYDPYFCGGCFYDNKCFAEAAWGGAGLPMDSCVAINPPVTVASSMCPTTPDDTACDLSYAPVTCDDDCKFDNQCLADAAGATGCASSCEVPGEVACTADFDPVTCPNGCQFSNRCLAEAAGNDPDTCTPFCPEPAEGTACTADFSPVVCPGSCVYSNSCEAEAAGFSDCTSISSSTAADCPTINGTVACTLDLNPQTCDGNCQYDNTCLAEAAGATNCMPSCPAPAGDAVCTTEVEIVACGGTQWCFYSNLCNALDAGQSEKDCTRDCPSETGDTVCTAEYAPVFCGGCIYSNECVANAAWVTSAGLPESSCVALSTLVASTTCPTVPEGTPCTLDYNPQTCDNDCKYDNTCLAEAAGATGCSSSCPLPDSEKACTREYEPYICDGCTYNNKCLADAAGFNTTDGMTCKPICQDPDATTLTDADGVACTAIYDPVYCFGCEYDSKCVAEALGYDVEEDCTSIATFTETAANGGGDTTTSGAKQEAIMMALTAVLVPLILA